MRAALQPPGPLTQLVKRTLAVANTNSQPVAFKVKTTAPKQYCVRPNSGRIEPGERVEVQGKLCRIELLVIALTLPANAILSPPSANEGRASTGH